MLKIVIKLFVVGLTAIIILSLSIWQGACNTSSNFIDEEIGTLAIKLLNENNIRLDKGTWYLVVLLNEQVNHYSFIKYLDYLVNKFEDYNLKIIILTLAKITTLSNNLSIENKKTFIFQNQLNSSSLKRLLRNSRQQRLICFIDSGGDVVFEANFARENDIRLILEKNLIGKINYDGRSDFSLKTGDYFNPLSVINIKTFEEKIIDDKLCPHLWLIFTSNCVSCALQSNLRSYSILEKGLALKLNIPTGLIFSPYFSMEEIESTINRLQIENDVFLSRDDLKGLENSYYKNHNSEKNVIAIIVGLDNKVIYIESFTVFYNHLQGDYFEKNSYKFIND